MSGRFEEQAIFVTGGSEGIGYATAEALAVEGAHVAICARRKQPLDAAAAKIRDAGGSVEAIQLDVGDCEALAAAVRDFAGRRGRLDGVVNNAYSQRHGAIADIDLDAWREEFAVNIDAPMVTMREAFRVMMGQGRGAIVNVSSINGIRAMGNTASYSAAKAGLIHLGAVAAIEGAAHGIRVNTVIPGLVRTEGADRFIPSDEVYERLSGSIPMARPGKPEEIARTILFLLSDDSSYVTGQAIVADGGKTGLLYVDL